MFALGIAVGFALAATPASSAVIYTPPTQIISLLNIGNGDLFTGIYLPALVHPAKNNGSVCNNQLGSDAGWESFITFKTDEALDSVSNTIASQKPVTNANSLSSMTLELYKGTVNSGSLLTSVMASIVAPNSQLVATLSYSNLLANTDYYCRVVSKLASGFTAGGWGGTAAFDAVVPLPAAAWLFGSAFLGLCWLGRRAGMRGAGMLPAG
ncbi:MAG: hypothetical protein ACJ8H8_05635 [Geminicoccaceae bacterium]